MNKSIFNKVYEVLKAEKTKIGQRAFNTLDREDIADIRENNGIFYFEFYASGNNCSNSVHDYLVKFIKRKFGFKYLYEMEGSL